MDNAKKHKVIKKKKEKKAEEENLIGQIINDHQNKLEDEYPLFSHQNVQSI